MATGYHELSEELSPLTRDQHRALTSMMEELQAVDWYNQRVAVTPDEELKAILAHNRDEEMEHAMMLLEWLRRNMPPFEEKMKPYLYASGSILAQEKQVRQAGATPSTSPTPPTPPAAESLGVGHAVKGTESW
jgi:ferritin-like protein